MGDLVCTAERVRAGSRREPVTYALRWHQGGIGVNRNRVIASARLGRVCAHTCHVRDVPVSVRRAAADAHRLMKAGLWGDVQAMATHRWKWSWLTLRRELVPIGGGSRG